MLILASFDCTDATMTESSECCKSKSEQYYSHPMDMNDGEYTWNCQEIMVEHTMSNMEYNCCNSMGENTKVEKKWNEQYMTQSGNQVWHCHEDEIKESTRESTMATKSEWISTKTKEKSTVSSSTSSSTTSSTSSSTTSSTSSSEKDEASNESSLNGCDQESSFLSFLFIGIIAII